jgi:hypothetical protein
VEETGVPGRNHCPEALLLNIFVGGDFNNKCCLFSLVL